MNKSQLLRNLARRVGLCDKWFSEWSDNETDDSLLDRYIRGIDFCIEHDYPSLGVIRSMFEDEQLRKKNIYLDTDHALLLHPSPVAVILGKSKCTITPTAHSVSDIYIRHESEVTINASGHAIVAVSVYDNAKVKVLSTQAAKVRVYRKSPSATIECGDDVILK